VREPILSLAGGGEMTTKTYPLSAIQEGSGMNKELALEILMLLSAIESGGFARDGNLKPVSLQDRMSSMITKLSMQVLK